MFSMNFDVTWGAGRCSWREEEVINYTVTGKKRPPPLNMSK